MPLASNAVTAGMVHSSRITTNPQTFKAHSLLCFWAMRELGLTAIEPSKKLKLLQPAISQSVKRGQKIAQELGLCLIEKGKQ